MTDTSIKFVSSRLNIKDQSLQQKAAEYMRFLQMKRSATTLSEISKATICLDLAAVQLGIGFDKVSAKNLTNLTKTAYQNSYNNIEKILKLDRNITVSEVCVQLGCTSVCTLAEKILEEYKKHDTLGKDLNHPQYVIAVVQTACQLNKIKMKTTDLLSLSKIQPKQMKELKMELMQFATSNGFGGEKSNGNKKPEGNNIVDRIHEQTKVLKLEEKKKIEDSNEQIESYEDWKERILNEAYEALKMEITEI